MRTKQRGRCLTSHNYHLPTDRSWRLNYSRTAHHDETIKNLPSWWRAAAMGGYFWGHITYDPHANLVAGTLVVTLNPVRVRPLPSPASTLVQRCSLFLASQLYFRRRHVYRSLSLASDLDEELSVCRYLCNSQGHLLQYDNSLNVVHDTIRWQILLLT